MARISRLVVGAVVIRAVVIRAVAIRAIVIRAIVIGAVVAGAYNGLAIVRDGNLSRQDLNNPSQVSLQ